MFIIDLMLGSAEHAVFLFGVHGAWRDAGSTMWNVLDLFFNDNNVIKILMILLL